MDLSATNPEQPAPGAPLRVAILLESLEQPTWVRTLLEELRESGDCHVVAAILDAGPDSRARSFRNWIRERWRRWACDLYLFLDNRLLGSADNARRPVNVADLLPSPPILVTDTVGHGPIVDLAERERRDLSDQDLDLVLSFVRRAYGDATLGLARHGFWSFEYGGTPSPIDAVPGFREVAAEHPVTIASIIARRASGGQGEILDYCAVATDRWSVHRNRSHLNRRASTLLIRVLRDFRRRGAAAIQGRREDVTSAPCIPGTRLPGNIETLRFIAGLGGRYGRSLVARLCTVQQWSLAFRLGPGGYPGQDTFEILRPPADRFWADPFPIRHQGRLFLFIEEVPRASNRGHIAVLALKTDGTWGPSVPALRQDTHLSYPCVFEWRGELYMVPETRSRNTVELYRCRTFPHDWVLERVLMENVHAVDATLSEVGDRWWMFVCMGAGIGPLWEELHLFHAPTPLGPWAPHPKNPVKSDARSARPAGRLFTKDGELYRPAQDCSRGYGYALSLQKIDRLDLEDYRETEVRRIVPGWDLRIRATHTWNAVDGLTVIDCRVLRRRFLPRST